MLKNLVTLGSGELLGRGMHAVAFLLLARALGNEALGQFGLATAVTSYALLAVSQGFDAIAMRDVARKHDDLKDYAGNILGLRLLLALGTGSAIGTYVLVTGLERTTGQLLLVLTVSYVASALTPRWCFLAIEKPRPLAVAGLLAQGCFLAMALLVRSPTQVLWAAGAQVVGEVVAASFLLALLVSRSGWLTVRFNSAFATRLVRQSWPVTLSLLLGNMLFNFDVLALGAMGRGHEIGVYLACLRCVSVFTPLLVALQTTTFPLLARSYPDYQLVRAQVHRMTRVAVVVFGAAGLTIGILAAWLLPTVFGAGYSGGVTILQVLAFILPIQASRVLFRQVLLAFHLQRVDTRNLALGVMTNVVLDLVLIPRIGALGCAVSTISAEIVFAGLSMVAVRRQLGTR